jgi:hypothetical protein
MTTQPPLCTRSGIQTQPFIACVYSYTATAIDMHQSPQRIQRTQQHVGSNLTRAYDSDTHKTEISAIDILIPVELRHPPSVSSELYLGLFVKLQTFPLFTFPTPLHLTKNLLCRANAKPTTLPTSALARTSKANNGFRTIRKCGRGCSSVVQDGC